MEKYPIDVALVYRLLAAQFPQWAGLPVSKVQPGGWDNRTFRLGERMLVRMPSAACYAAKVAKEQEWLPKLASHLPLPIPIPLAMGHPSEGYPWHWSIYQWIDGETASLERIADLCQFAIDLASFLAALQRVDASDGLPAGAHNFYRGGLLATYDAEVQEALAKLTGKIDVPAARAVWNEALVSTWQQPPVWVHGDVAVGNLLVKGGKLCAVIDFGGMAVGDPACDLVIAWTLLNGESREAFRAALPLDEATWARARGWALWKALIVCAGLPGTDSAAIELSKRVIDEVLADQN